MVIGFFEMALFLWNICTHKLTQLPPSNESVTNQLLDLQRTFVNYKLKNTITNRKKSVHFDYYYFTFIILYIIIHIIYYNNT